MVYVITTDLTWKSLVLVKLSQSAILKLKKFCVYLIFFFFNFHLIVMKMTYNLIKPLLFVLTLTSVELKQCELELYLENQIPLPPTLMFSLDLDLCDMTLVQGFEIL